VDNNQARAICDNLFMLIKLENTQLAHYYFDETVKISVFGINLKILETSTCTLLISVVNLSDRSAVHKYTIFQSFARITIDLLSSLISPHTMVY
jgi:hypothetical protein